MGVLIKQGYHMKYALMLIIGIIVAITVTYDLHGRMVVDHFPLYANAITDTVGE